MSQDHYDYGVSSSPYNQYSVPAEQQFKANGESFYPVSEANTGVYTSSNSLVLSGTGRTVYSNPGSPKSLMADALKLNHQRTSYCDNQLPLPVRTDSTLVICDDNHSAYVNAFSSSNMSMVMPQMAGGGGGSYDLDDGQELPNEVCNSRNSNVERLHAKMLLNEACSVPVDPLQGRDVYFREPASVGTDYSVGPHSSSSDCVSLSILLDSHSMATPDEDGIGSMVTGLGSGGGDEIPTQFPFQTSQTVFEEGEFDTMIRDLMGADLTHLVSPTGGMPDAAELLKFIDSGAAAIESSLSECASTPMTGDLINGFDGMSIQPVQAQNYFPNHRVEMGEAVQEQSSTGDTLDIIKMMNVPQLKPSAPSALGLVQSRHMVPTGHIPSPVQSGHFIPPSPIATPITPGVPIQASVPPSSPPQQPPATPGSPEVQQTSTRNGPFELKTYVEGAKRVCEITLGQDLNPEQQQFAAQALYFSLEAHLKIAECLKKPCDLKVAIDARAELSGLKFDAGTATLQFTIPKECVHIDEWMRKHKDSIDLLDRQLVFQQVANLLAAVHTNGNTDKLCLWGSFVVWVAPDKRVYILIDFPDMLRKMEEQASSMSFDPRIEDVKAIYEIYQKVFFPFINQDSSWVSPGVKLLVESFDRLVRDPTCVYSVAGLARILGERRLCKLEVELMTLCHYVYCVEHEPLQTVLSHITSMVPPVACDRWEVQWAESGKIVEHGVIASAHRHMRLQVQPVARGPVAMATQQQPPACLQGLSFKESGLQF